MSCPGDAILIHARPSKSAMHRGLIAAALADRPTELHCHPGQLPEDVEATVRGLKAMGAAIEITPGKICVIPINATDSMEIRCDCGESGSTLRFLMPVAAAALKDACVLFTGEGRLGKRPHGVLCHVLQRHGCDIDSENLPLRLSGHLRGGVFELPGNVSSQYITGLLLALPLTGEGGRIVLTTSLQSAGYVDMTLQTLAQFGIAVEKREDGWFVPGSQRYFSPGIMDVEGDWSNASVMLAAGAVGKYPVTVKGLCGSSVQRDSLVVKCLERMGAEVSKGSDEITVFPSRLHGIAVDMSDIPDLFPVLAVLGALADGTTLLTNASRLRLKESDRLAAMAQMLKAAGVSVSEKVDSLEIEGGVVPLPTSVNGESMPVYGDHRLVMAASLLALGTGRMARVDMPQAVCKSYPDFWEDWSRILKL